MATKALDPARYLRSVAEHWYQATLLQQARCMELMFDSVRRRIDLNFYVVAIERLREVAHQANRRLRIAAAADAVAQFDKAWPRFKELRNLEEHHRGPSGDYPAGIWYFSDSVIDGSPHGGVEYLVAIDDTQRDAERLYNDLMDCLSPENPPPDGP